MITGVHRAAIRAAGSLGRVRMLVVLGRCRPTLMLWREVQVRTMNPRGHAELDEQPQEKTGN